MHKLFINDWWLATQIATPSTAEEQNYYSLTLNSELTLPLIEWSCDLQAASNAEGFTAFNGWEANVMSTEFTEEWTYIIHIPAVGYVAFAEDTGAGSIGRVSTSPDGITWTARTSPNVNNWNSPTYVPSKGLIVVPTGSNFGINGDNFVTSADNGVTWVAGTTGILASVGKIPDMNHIIWVESLGLYIMTGFISTILWSTDLVTWTEGTMAQPLFLGLPSVLVYAPALGLIVALDSTGVAYTSADGKNWTHNTLGTGFDLFYYDLAWSEPLGLFVATTEHHGVTNTLFISSTDGVNWVQTPIGIPLVQHVDGQDTFLRGGQIEWDDNTNKFYTLTSADDNGNFTGQSLMTPSMNLLTSVDGTTWVIDTTVPSTHDFSYPVFGTKHFVGFAIKDADNMVMINSHAAIHKIP